MCKLRTRLAFLIFLTAAILSFSNAANALVKGIYLTQSTVEDTDYLAYLIKHAKAVGINTFIADLEIPSKKYEKNIQMLKENDITYVARVIVFPQGGKPGQIEDVNYWEKRYNLIRTAVNYGAQQVQLDYIRYNSKQPASSQHAKNIFKVVQYYKDKLQPQGIPLQADVFGIASFGESSHIGQNLRMMAESVDALCPMVYPSHYEPYRLHAVTPYQTIYSSLKAIRSQLTANNPVKLYAYIEISNYRYPLPGSKRRAYVLAEMKAVQDAGADGYYVWSAHNKYDYLFNLLAELQKQSPDDQEKTLQAGVADSTRLQDAKQTADASSTESNDDDSADLNQKKLSFNESFTPWPQAQNSVLTMRF